MLVTKFLGIQSAVKNMSAFDIIAEIQHSAALEFDRLKVMTPGVT
jgi:hypothetical protein